MAKWASTLVLDAPWTFLKNNVKKLVILTNTVSTASFAGCTQATVLAYKALSSANFAIADDSTLGGRKITISSLTTIPVNATGAAAFIALGASATSDSTMASTGLFYITSCATQALTSTNNAVTTPAWSITFKDPT